MAAIHDQPAMAPSQARPGWKGCLTVLLIPVIVWLGVWFVQSTFFLSTWQLPQADRATFSADGQFVAVFAGPMTSIPKGVGGGYTTVEVRRATDRRVVRSFMIFPSRQVVFAPDGQLLATAGLDRLLRLYSSDGTLRLTLDRPVNGWQRITFSTDGQWLITSAPGQGVYVWRVRDGSLVHTLLAPGEVFSSALSRDGQLLAADASNMLVLWDLTTGRELRRFKDENPSALAFTPDGALLASWFVRRQRDRR